ncbi:MAG: protein kinase [Xanthomonadales bacterium]|nr:protein kinase [Xanthomonadales bacterium]
MTNPSGQVVTQWWRDPALAQMALGAETIVPAKSPPFEGEASIARDLPDHLQHEFGDYELLECIGQGGIGMVYRARQRDLDREVAIKLLSAGVWASSDFVVRFHHEAQHAARLQHPGIVTIFEMGEFDGLVYYAMQLVRGVSLARNLNTGTPWPPREAALLLRQIAEAVAYAHSLGVLHLDLKPGNVLINEDGHPLIADFGLARRIEAASNEEFIAGTPGYMAPEQAVAGYLLSEETDVWSLGAILHELLDGKPPRPDGNGPATGPIDLRAICRKCIAEAPSQRYSSARALADDLGRFLDGRAVQARPLNVAQRALRWTRREPRLAIVAGLGMLALLIGTIATGLQWQRAEASAKSAREQTWNIRDNSSWDALRNGHQFDAVPALLANLREREANGDTAGVALERLRLGTLRQNNVQWIDAIPAGKPGYAVALNRDGSRVAVSTGEEDLSLYDTRDGRELWRTNTLHASHMWAYRHLLRLDFTRDGRYLIAERGEPYFITRPSGQDNILIDAADGRILLPPPHRFPDFRDATYSRDGRFALLRNDHHQAQLFHVEDWRAVSPLRSMAAVNGMWLVGDDGRFLAQSVSGKIELREPRTLETRHILRNHVPDALFPVWAAQPGGDLLAIGANDNTVHLLDTRTLSIRELKPSPYVALAWLSFSPDGHWLTAAAGDRAFVWDTGNGTGGALPAGRYDATRVEADADSGTVLVTTPPEAVLWQLPTIAGSSDMTTRISGARKVVAQLSIGFVAEDHSAVYAPAAHLAATIDIDGELRLWRWQREPLLSAHAAPRITSGLYFDGRHVAVVDGNQARVITVADERAASPSFTHPQPVSSAQLTADGESLVTSSARELRVFDWHKDRLRFPPIILDNSPLRVETDPQAHVLLVSTGEYRGNAFQERLSVYDLHTGKLLAAGVDLPGPLAGLRFSSDGRQVILWRFGEATVRDSSRLRVVGKSLVVGPDVANALRHVYTTSGWRSDAATEADKTGTPVIDASPDPGAQRLTVLTGTSQFTDAQLLDFDLRSGRRISRRSLGKGQPLGLLVHGDTYESVQWMMTVPRWLSSTGTDRNLPQTSTELSNVQAISRDGRLLASVNKAGGIVLADHASGEWAAAPMAAPLPMNDSIAQLSFAPDAGSLLARSYYGRWLWWPLPRETRSTAQLQALLERVHPGTPGDGKSSDAVTAALRASLRQHDSGPPRRGKLPQAVSAPREPTWSATPLPGYAFVDLTPASNHSIGMADGVRNDNAAVFAGVTPGVQRYLGIDYDIRNMIALSMKGLTPNPFASRAVPLTTPCFNAAYVLIGASTRLQNMNRFPNQSFGYLDLNYADGGHARIPIVYGRDLMAAWIEAGDALPMRIAWVETGPQPNIFPNPRYRLYAARFPNPHPLRPVSSVAFSATELAWSGPMILAMTLETGTQSFAHR